ncbi:hypothetical protein [Microterricola viridarii]|uniref:Uncharacterized protein n=1 Tax=Microterricola viridarii TaxID=412690 RepID=A0A120HZR4_9MICO|nr:hypothetical protein [Microterricola viridarii]AMB57662.1 hypothetical protein AWU67_00950 [Microterricola viridarii]
MSDTTPEHENHEGTESTDAEPTPLEPRYDETGEIPAESLPAFFAEPVAPAEAAAVPTPDTAVEAISEPEPTPLGAPAAAVVDAAPVAPTPQPYYPEAAIAAPPVAPEVDHTAGVAAAAGAAAAAATVANPTAPGATYDPNTVAAAGQYAPGMQPIFVQAPTPPSPKGNRGAGILIGLIATVAFALIYAGSTFLISLSQNASVATASESFALFIGAPVFYVPVLFFFGAFALLVAIVNRGGWWAYVLGGFAVAVIVYFSFIGGSLLTVSAWTLTPSQAGQFIAGQWLNPVAIVAAIAAREVPIWFGAWIAARGRKVTARNIAVRQEYDRVLAEGPTLTRP